MQLEESYAVMKKKKAPPKLSIQKEVAFMKEESIDKKEESSELVRIQRENFNQWSAEDQAQLK